jgi:hypothetical protein
MPQTFAQWMQEVNQCLEDTFGLCAEDLSQATYKKYYDENIPADDIIFYMNVPDEVIQ